jgi:hypothetical protein
VTGLSSSTASQLSGQWTFVAIQACEWLPANEISPGRSKTVGALVFDERKEVHDAKFALNRLGFGYVTPRRFGWLVNSNPGMTRPQAKPGLSVV